MKIDVTPLLADIGASEKFVFSEKLKIDIDEENKLKDKVFLKASITNSGMGLIVTGQIETKVTMSCSICLKEFDEKLCFSFEERFVSETEAFFPEDKEYEIQEGDIYFTYGSDFVLDFSEMIRELIILNLPIAPKCDINCQVQERENKKTIDPRLAVLAKLKKNGGL